MIFSVIIPVRNERQFSWQLWICDYDIGVKHSGISRVIPLTPRTPTPPSGAPENWLRYLRGRTDKCLRSLRPKRIS